MQAPLIDFLSFFYVVFAKNSNSCPGVCSFCWNFSERQILWSLCSVDFYTLTLQLPIQTPHSVAPELQVFVSSLKISAKRAHPWALWGWLTPLCKNLIHHWGSIFAFSDQGIGAIQLFRYCFPIIISFRKMFDTKLDIEYWPMPVADPGFLVGGGAKPARGGGSDIRFCQIFQKLHEIEAPPP